MATKTEKEIKLEVLQIGAEIANTSWIEASAKVKYEAEKSNATTYTLPPDQRMKVAVRNAKALYKFIDSTDTITSTSVETSAVQTSSTETTSVSAVSAAATP